MRGSMNVWMDGWMDDCVGWYISTHVCILDIRCMYLVTLITRITSPPISISDIGILEVVVGGCSPEIV